MKAALVVTVVIMLALMLAFPIGSPLDRWLVWIALVVFCASAWLFHGRQVTS